MISNFMTEIEGTAFEFNTMNAERLQLFQIYVQDQGVKKRFHMQLNGENRFRFADKSACPAFCLGLEDALHNTILENQVVGASTIA